MNKQAKNPATDKESTWCGKWVYWWGEKWVLTHGIPTVGWMASPLSITLLILLCNQLGIRTVGRRESKAKSRYIYLMGMTADSIFKFLRKQSHSNNSSSDNTNWEPALIAQCCKRVPCIISSFSNSPEDILSFTSPFFWRWNWGHRRRKLLG